MLNTRDLEKRWLRYKLKSYIPHAVIVVSLLVITTIAFIITTTTPEKEEHTEIAKSIKPVVKKPTKPIERNNTSLQTVQQETPVIKTAVTVPKTNTNNQQLVLKPSMHFMKQIQSEEQQPYYKTLHKSKQKTKKRNKIINQQKTIEEEYIDIEKNKQKSVQQTIQKKEPDQKSVITIKRRESQNDIKEIIARFKKNNNPALSLFVAKKSYELGNYEQAYNYALITNGINNDIEDSWLIFAKSLVKLGKRDMAAKTLREYIHYSHSGNAKILLNDIESGKFR